LHALSIGKFPHPMRETDPEKDRQGGVNQHAPEQREGGVRGRSCPSMVLARN
jgi:hypothetical protein